jgi:hypothetical protein
MHRGALITGVVVVVLGALLFIRPFATREREYLASTPAAPSLFTPPVPLELKPGDQLCDKDLPLDHDSQLARFSFYTYGKRGVPLAVSASGPGYSYRGTFPGGWAEGPVELPLRPPAQSMDGQICVKNTGSRKVAIQATPVGQRFSRPQPYLNGGPLEQDVPLTLHRRKPANLIAQTPRALRHASVFVPFAPWALWILLALVLLGIPAAVVVAVSRAAVEPVGPTPDPLPLAPRVPLSRLARRARGPARVVAARARRVPTRAWLALLLVVALAFTYLWASRMGSFQNDESQNVYFARWMTHNLPSALWNFSQLQRGLQRAEIYVLALTLGTLGTPAAFLVAHFLNALAFVSTAVPMYLLTRGLGARGRWPLLAALLGVATPWLVFATSFLTEPLAYPAAVWLLWATWRAIVEPRPATQLTALAVLFVALLTRSAFLILIPLLPVVVVVHELRYGRLRDWRGVSRRHQVVVAMVALGALALLASIAGVLPDPSRLTGSYGTPFSVVWSPFLSKIAHYASRVVVGTGFIPFAIGLPWLVRQLIRPDDERTHAFALTAVVAVVLLLYASSPAGPDERYVIYFGPPLSIAAVVAIARRRLGWGWVAAGGLLAAILVYKQGWNPEGGAYGFFVGPSESFYARVGLLRLDQYVPAWLTLQQAAFIVALAVTAVCAYAFTRGARARTVLACLVAMLVVLQTAQAAYTTSKFVTQGGARFGPSHSERTWVDQAIYGKGTAAIVGLGQGNTGIYDPIWAEIQFWNTSVTSEFAFAPLAIQLPPGDYPGSIRFDATTGQASSTPKLPPYAVLPRGYVDIGLAGTPIAHATYVPADLVRVARPLRVTFQVSGAQADGYIAPKAPVSIRFFAAGLDPARHWCGVVPLSAPVDVSGRKPLIRYRLGGRAGALKGGTLVNAKAPLAFRGRGYVDVPLVASTPVKLSDGRVVSLQVGQISVAGC